MIKVKRIGLIIIFILTVHYSSAQNWVYDNQTDEYYGSGFAPNIFTDSTINKNDTISIPSDFKSKIELEKRTEDYKYLRAYKIKKEALLSQNEKTVSKYQEKISSLSRGIFYKTSEYRYVLTLISKTKTILTMPKFDPKNPTLGRLDPSFYNKANITKEEIQQLMGEMLEKQKVRKENIKKDSLTIVQAQKVWSILTQNKQNIESDIEECITAIDAAIAPEYKNQSFKRQISIAFSILIGVLIVAFFVVVYVRSDKSISVILLSDGGLQFVTIFVLIIAIILFGVLDILKSNELSAILSGIAGYILGKNGRISGNQNSNQPTTPQTPTYTSRTA